MNFHPVISKKHSAVLAPPGLTLFLIILITLSGCTGGRRALVDSPAYRNRRAQALLTRSEVQLRNNEFAPAVTDVFQAERFCEDDALLAEIHMHREYMLNHMSLFTSVEDGNTLRYTLLYKRDEVFYPVDNLQVRFTFMKGSGVMAESARTDTSGTARSKIERLNGLRTKFIIEAVPVVMAGDEEARIEELRFNYILNNTGDGDRPNLEQIRDVFLESVKLSIWIIDEVLEDLFED